MTYLGNTTNTPLQPYDIYNLNASFKREQRNGLSANDALIRHLTDKKIHFKIKRYTREPERDTYLLHIHKSIQLAQTNQDVILVDNTYKTNNLICTPSYGW